MLNEINEDTAGQNTKQQAKRKRCHDFLIDIYPSIEYLRNKLKMDETIIKHLWGGPDEVPFKDDNVGDELLNCTFCQAELWAMFLKCESCKLVDDVLSCALCDVAPNHT